MFARKSYKEKLLTTNAQEEQARARLYSLENVMALQQALGQGIVWDDLAAEHIKHEIRSKDVSDKASRNVIRIVGQPIADLTFKLRALFQIVVKRGRTNRQTSAR